MRVVDKILGEAMTRYQQSIVNNPEKAYQWAKDHKQRFPEAEAAIATKPQWAYVYARDVIKGRWPEAEAFMIKEVFTKPNEWAANPYWTLQYAKDVVKGRWPEAEPILAKEPSWAVQYARDVIKGRWPEGEMALVKDPWRAKIYAREVIKGRWPEAEPAIVRSDSKDDYLNTFPEAREDWAMNGWIDWMDT